MISKKTIISGLFSLMLGAALLAMPARAMANDWGHDHDRGGWGHDNGRHEGWSRHRDNDDRWRGYNRDYRPNYGYRYNHEEEEEHEYRPGYRYNSWNRQPGYGYYQPGYTYPRNGQGMISRSNPNMVWSCDSQGHHCHWAPRIAAGYGYAQPGYGEYNYGGYNSNYNGYNGNPLGAVVGSFLGVPVR